MTKKEIREIRNEIEEKKKEKDDIKNKALKSQSVSEVKGLNEKLTEINNELEALQEKLTSLIEEEYGEEEENVNDYVTQKNSEQRDIIRGIYGSGSSNQNGEPRSLGKFNMRTGFYSGNIDRNRENGLALRSGETFTSRIRNTSSEKLDLGKYIRGAITGNWNGAETERRALTSSTSGVVIPQILSAEILDTARNVSFFTEAGCPIVPMENGNMTIARLTQDPSFKFYGEMQEASESNMSIEGIVLKAKTARGFCYVSKELLVSAQNLHQVLVNAFSGAIAEMIDFAGLYGQYDTVGGKFEDVAPSGIMNDTNIKVIKAKNRFYEDYIKAIGVVRRANGIPDTIGYNAAGEEVMNLVCDVNGQPIAMPKVIEDMNKIVTNSLKEDQENGSDAIIMDKTAVVVGLQNSVFVRMTDNSDYCIKHGCVCFDVSVMIDVATVRPSHICKITGIKIA